MDDGSSSHECPTTTTAPTDATSSLLVPNKNELSTAASYCVLYRRHHHRQQQQEKPNESTSEEDSFFWRNDEWTEDDFHQAKELLEKSRYMCEIPKRFRFNKDQKKKQDIAQHWNRFYQHHQTNFFNDRHYLSKAFPHEFSASSSPQDKDVLLVEIGCGVGNNVLPLLERFPRWTIYGYDFSPVAVNLLRQDPRFQQASCRAHASVWDISTPTPSLSEMEAQEDDDHHGECNDSDHHGPVSSSSSLSSLPPTVSLREKADIVTLLFCLSALSPTDQRTAAQNMMLLLKPGGVLVFRDYGRYDQAQMKLGTSRSKQLDDNFYVKSDGTRCYYFTLQDLTRLFGNELETLELGYIRRVYHNRSNQQQRRRVWVQARFKKR